MVKIKYFSVYNDFRTGLFCKISFILGFILLIVYAIIKIIFFVSDENSSGFIKTIYDFSQNSQSDAIIAFSLLFFALGVILLFFHYQFAKLAKIAEDIENSNDLDETD